MELLKEIAEFIQRAQHNEKRVQGLLKANNRETFRRRKAEKGLREANKRIHKIEEALMSSGYTFCMCRDCFETVVSDDMDSPDFCDECVSGGCLDYQGVDGLSQECQKSNDS